MLIAVQAEPLWDLTHFYILQNSHKRSIWKKMVGDITFLYSAHTNTLKSPNFEVRWWCFQYLKLYVVEW